jgi:nudix-type nucleoside diphosphatase (YffH/AdpP family)
MDLFVYGTLRSHALMAAVAGEGPLDPVECVLAEFSVFPLKGNVVPFIAPLHSGNADGLLWQGLTQSQLNRLNAYEGAFGYVLTTVEVQTANGSRSAQCYLPPSEHAAGEGKWSLQDWEEGHLAPAILAATELFSFNPVPDHADLRRMWPMIEARAWAKFRATAGPATRRYQPGSADFDIVTAQPPQGGFFQFQSVDIQHRTFMGGRSDVLTREGFFGVDAAILLPYDPVRDKVLLVEQARLGPRLRHDPNPWMLEPVAGIVDARETPQEAALREGREEAGLKINHLEQAGAFYVSPGSTTDYFYSFVGLCDLPQTETYFGGLPGEHEDLRLHPMSFDDALALVDSGEITTGPLIFLLYWLLRHRDRLRA